jgi:chromosome segregation ATPase
MAVTLKEKEELESDNRVLAESYKTVNTQQEALASQLKTLTHEKMKLESDVKKKEQIIENQSKNIKEMK